MVLQISIRGRLARWTEVRPYRAIGGAEKKMVLKSDIVMDARLGEISVLLLEGAEPVKEAAAVKGGLRDVCSEGGDCVWSTYGKTMSVSL